MNAAELLEQARGLGATFTVPEPGRVHVSAPEPLPDELMSALRELKPQVLDLLTHVPDYSITACVCDQPIGGTGPERCEVCWQPLVPTTPGVVAADWQCALAGESVAHEQEAQKAAGPQPPGPTGTGGGRDPAGREHSPSPARPMVSGPEKLLHAGLLLRAVD